MKTVTSIVLCAFSLIVVVGCASTKVTNRQLVTEKLPKPAHIWIYDFSATPSDIPADSALTGEHTEHSTPPTAEQIATGRELGAQIRAELVDQVREMGLPAKHGVRGTLPEINDIVIRGYLLSIVEGSAVKRVALGFGSGDSELKVAAEGFQMTPDGLRKLGSGTTDSGGGKAPGAALGAASLIVTHNPVGLIVGTGVKIYGEETGSSKVEGRATATAKEISAVLKKRFQEQQWIN